MADFAEVAAVGCYVGLCGVRWDKQDRGTVDQAQAFGCNGTRTAAAVNLIPALPYFYREGVKGVDLRCNMVSLISSLSSAM